MSWITHLVPYEKFIIAIFTYSNSSKATDLMKEEEDEDHWQDIKLSLLPIQEDKGMK